MCMTLDARRLTAHVRTDCTFDREFEHRNPVIASREIIDAERPQHALVAQFVARQQREMDRGAHTHGCGGCAVASRVMNVR